MPSDSQRTAICHEAGPMLVMAGPGSGKTFVMTERILYLIHNLNVSPNQILVISFSKAAALQLRERFYVRNQHKMEDISFATFHAFFFQIIKEVYQYTSKDIIQLKEKIDLLSTILMDPAYSSLQKEEEDKSPSKIREKAEELLQKISFYKNRSKKEMEEREDSFFISIFHAYNQQIHTHHKLDFDDMGLLCLNLLKKDSKILKKWQDKYTYIMIDEFQDINEIQFQIINLLAKGKENLFVVGDDDQAIYSFRGASPKFMINFEKYYPGAQKVLLETNFRCSKRIVEKSLLVIGENKQRIQKEIESFDQSEEEVVLKGFNNPYEEYEYITEKILEYLRKGTKAEDICCIFRTNSFMIPLTQVMIRKKIPVSLKEKCSSIYHHFVALDIYHYLKFFFEGKKRKDFLVIMNKPLRYLSRNACKNEEIRWEDLFEYYKEKEYMKKVIEDMKKMEQWVTKLDFFGAIYYFRKVGGYEAYLKEYCKRKDLGFNEIKDILDFVHNSFRGVSCLEEWEDQIRDFEKILKKNKESNEGVVIMTMHACKGLEFNNVFLPDCNEGKVPHTKAITMEEIEEERRMFYVAMTRAKKHLEILYLENKEDTYLQKSRFLEVIAKK